MRISNRFEKHIVAAATVAMGAAATANAAVVTWNCNLIVPNTNEGVYINVETQVYGSVPGLVAGWDINPYGHLTSDIDWVPPDSTGTYVNGFGQGGTAQGVANLSNGTLVDGSSTYPQGGGTSSVTKGGWILNGANAFGFRFLAADGLTHYAYGIMTVGANFGVRTLTSVSYESVAGVGITVVSVPAPGALALLGVAGLAGARRRRA
jgi:MYXO-CTERM domain-containing protein